MSPPLIFVIFLICVGAYIGATLCRFIQPSTVWVAAAVIPGFLSIAQLIVRAVFP
jgi:uncharacterized membrane protein YoaK (UPF0700 family)